jgi:hypothetical protein
VLRAAASSQRNVAPADQVPVVPIAKLFDAEVLVTLRATPRRQVVIDVAIPRQKREHASFREQRQGRANEREQSIGKREIASIDGNDARSRDHQ